MLIDTKLDGGYLLIRHIRQNVCKQNQVVCRAKLDKEKGAIVKATVEQNFVLYSPHMLNS
jgi:hypothetical protein